MFTKTFSVLNALLTPLVDELRMRYWVVHTGVDGYTYLLF